LAALNADPKVGLETLRVKTQCYFWIILIYIQTNINFKCVIFPYADPKVV
jgi:hypothetical protein